MNILPKKRWHVRNKDNIARVRRDEAKAELEKNEKEQRQKLAEREARTNLLRDKAKIRVGYKDFIPLSLKKESQDGGHINFFQDVEDGFEESSRTNKEHEKEKKEETEKYEKQIGYLTYLGQDTNEALGKKNWYDEVPNREDNELEEVNLKSKLKEDPLETMKKYLPSSNFQKNETSLSNSVHSKSLVIKKHDPKSGSYAKTKKKHKHMKIKDKSVVCSKSKYQPSNVEKKSKLEILRLERINREKEEKRRSDSLLAEYKTKNVPSTIGSHTQRKYNSQFNPDLARQNYI